MSAEPLISIIITSYNYGHMIEQALRSACAQDYPNLEILILDNASTDNTYDVVKPYLADRRVRFIPSETNLGMTPNHNRGIRETRGDFVNFLAADDMLLPGYISRAYQYLKTHPKTDLVYGAVVAMDEGGQICQHLEVDGQVQVPYSGRRLELAALLSHSCYMSFPTLLTRRALYERFGGLDENLKSIDYEIVMRWAAHHVQFAYLPEAMVAARVHANEQSSYENCIATGDWLCDFVYVLELYCGPRYAEQLAGYEQTIAQALGKRIMQAQGAGFTVDAALSSRIAAAFERLRIIYDHNHTAAAPERVTFAILSDGRVENVRASLKSLYEQNEFPNEVLVFEQPGPSLAPLIHHENIAREACFMPAVRQYSDGDALRASALLGRGTIFAWIHAGQRVDRGFVAACRDIVGADGKPHAIIANGKDAKNGVFVIRRNTIDESGYNREALDRLLKPHTELMMSA